MILRKNINKPVHIYILTDPITGEVKYVGQTMSPKVRLSGHIINARNNVVNPKLCEWINSLVEQGKQPVIQIIETLQWSDADDRELYWIEHHRTAGSPLMNTLRATRSRTAQVLETARRNDPEEYEES